MLRSERAVLHKRLEQQQIKLAAVEARSITVEARSTSVEACTRMFEAHTSSISPSPERQIASPTRQASRANREVPSQQRAVPTARRARPAPKAVPLPAASTPVPELPTYRVIPSTTAFVEPPPLSTLQPPAPEELSIVPDVISSLPPTDVATATPSAPDTLQVGNAFSSGGERHREPSPSRRVLLSVTPDGGYRATILGVASVQPSLAATEPVDATMQPGPTAVLAREVMATSLVRTTTDGFPPLVAQELLQFTWGVAHTAVEQALIQELEEASVGAAIDSVIEGATGATVQAEVQLAADIGTGVPTGGQYKTIETPEHLLAHLHAVLATAGSELAGREASLLRDFSDVVTQMHALADREEVYVQGALSLTLARTWLTEVGARTPPTIASAAIQPKLSGILSYWDESQRQRLQSALQSWAAATDVSSGTPPSSLAPQRRSFLGRLTQSFESVAPSIATPMREREESLAAKLRLNVSVWSEAHARRTVKELSSECDTLSVQVTHWHPTRHRHRHRHATATATATVTASAIASATLLPPPPPPPLSLQRHR